MISIINKQKVSVNRKRITRDAQHIMSYLGYADFDLAILLTDAQTMHEYNKTYRGYDKPTDILSFPFHANLKAGDRITPKTDDEKNLGDLIIAPEVVQEELPQWNQSFDERMRHVLIHGICHLLGYDHIKERDYKIMHAQENEILTYLQKINAL